METSTAESYLSYLVAFSNLVPVLSGNVTVLEDVAMVQVCLRLSVPLSANLTVPLTLGNSGSATAGKILGSSFCDDDVIATLLLFRC